MKPVVAIDGHAGSGKGTMARMLASYLGFAHLDSGGLYRIAAYMQLNLSQFQGSPPENLVSLLSKMSMQDLLEMQRQISEDVLRSDIMSIAASSMSKLPEVRNVITKFIREFAADPGRNFLGSVIDGRDIGSVAVPNAVCKIFLTAEPQIRAKRRFKTLKAKNSSVTFEEICQNIIARDQQDSSRDTAPLTLNDDYIIINTSNETIEESFEKIVKIICDSVINR
ncbi:MAG: (d)CMP kinase [Holosporaceae bacterium]|jgi:cytidylate kinase|nr:(d)CMP kinase [Holosporaceae bacterium]